MTRPGGPTQGSAELSTHLEGRLAASADRLRAAPAGLVWFQPVTELDISATRIRELLRAGRSARYLVPDAVLDFIRSSGLYSFEP
jgi:nicotinate-nucleotide adenylyltransferase